jgi:choice-of-anchor C domain-containing protein
MRTALPLAALLALTAAAAPVPKFAPELVANGSFEEGPDGQEWWTLAEGSDTITGWVVTRGGIDLLTTNWQAGAGKRSLDLHASPGIGGVKQTIKTTKGRTYAVTFRMAGNPGGSVAEKSLWVAAGEAKEKFTFDTKGQTHEDMGWEKKEWEFTAAGDETVLEFYSAETADEFAGPALDDVSVKKK